jgi:dihydrofolate synthase / folylpolyglutamate synthase
MQSDVILERLMTLHPKIIDLSLDRMWRILNVLDHPEMKLPPVIHVAGTNGKGSLIAYLRAILEAAGYRVHAYTSPHLVRFNERIRLTGHIISEETLSGLLERCEQANGGDNITYFEITTAAALLAFSQTPADILLLETGLGGRLDATNVLDKPTLTAITPVSLDHHQYLGTTIADVAYEKAGIIKQRVPLVVGQQSAEGLAVIEARAKALDAPTYISGSDWVCHNQHSADSWIYESDGAKKRYSVPALAGIHQTENAATALACLDLLKNFDVSDEAIKRGLATVYWPARMHPLTNGPIFEKLPPHVEVWLDGGHNAAAAEQISNSFQKWNKFDCKPTYLICGMLNTKNQAAFFQSLDGLIEGGATIPVMGEPASTPAVELSEIARAVDVALVPCNTLELAVEALLPELEKRPCRLLIAGSLYGAGHILKTHG